MGKTEASENKKGNQAVNTNTLPAAKNQISFQADPKTKLQNTEDGGSEKTIITASVESFLSPITTEHGTRIISGVQRVRRG